MYTRISNSDFRKLIKFNQDRTLELEVISDNINFSDSFKFYSSSDTNDSIIISGFKDKNKEILINSFKLKTSSISQVRVAFDENYQNNRNNSNLKLILDDNSLISISFEISIELN
ncbi:hypothetical protein VN21_17455 [Paraclostridium benzoelyticum]|uniref:Uncharacterized protein n=1 Tax=Paraclostridium benzoelyticum TaxID=1629550 RepID=A0A0M3DEQ0_9FIRM|nr:hypothetical protein [Paraclostridium benzoelyticum]KKX99861.1 hypothetical protein VN21_17455 [Paraclostridium benzoelyticum]